MKPHLFLTILFTAALASGASAQPEYFRGGKPDLQLDDLTCRMNTFEASQIDQFLAAKKVTVYALDEVLDSDEFEGMCNAMDTSGAMTRMHAAIKNNNKAASWFKEHGVDPDRVVLMVQNTDNTVDLYIQ